MISQIRGRLISVQPQCVVEVGGVGFELLIPEKDRESIAPDDADALFYTYLYVREDRLNLYGFLRREDRALFLKLIDVSGVGPKLALGMLSLHPTEQIVGAIQRRDAGFLTQLPGLGKRTAEKVVVELAGKLDDIAAAEPEMAAPSSVRDDVIMALTSLGMTRHAAESALDKMRLRPDDTSSVEEIVKEALKYAGNV
jgi:Holliday junction DNA helicase RuvA